MRTQDMTAGKPLQVIIRFALPMMAGNLCQQLYTLVDAFFVGRFAGFKALAAVGAADWLSWLVFGIAWGYTQGFSILISQRFGAGEFKGVKMAVGNSLLLTAIICVFISAASILLTEPVLHLLNTPDDVFGDAAVYLYILFGALPVLGAYNVQAGILRAVGDAKTPLYAMLLASCVNIGLDALFVIAFHWGVAGAAVATVIAQGGIGGILLSRAAVCAPGIAGKGRYAAAAGNSQAPCAAGYPHCPSKCRYRRGRHSHPTGDQ